MPILIILVGFVMMTLGVALLLMGEAPFVAGKRIPALRARLIGGVLVGFLPASWVVRSVTNAIFPDAVDGSVVVALMFSLCGLVTIGILFRVMVPKREPREAPKPPPAADGSSKVNPFGAAQPTLPEPPPEPLKPPSGKTPRKAAAQDNNPFDFG